MKDFPVIETERLVLKYVTSNQVDEVFQHFANEKVNKYVDFDAAENIADAQEIIDWGTGLYMNNKGIFWGIFSKTDDIFMGQVNFANRSSNNFTDIIHRSEIGFDLSPQFWGNGYMTEAMNSAISWIFNSYKIQIKRIEAIINTKNRKAEELVIRVGFQKEGILRDYVVWNNELWDMSLFSLLKKEWV
jgi:ribosomal-protein-alanine N-acetyltransferase